MAPSPDPAATPSASSARRKRVGWLLACFSAGGIVGVVGSAVTGSDLWYLAIPVAVASVWMIVADPTKCEPLRDRGPGRPGQ